MSVTSNSTMLNMNSPTKPRAVIFSQFGEFVFIPKDNIESKWYSTQEKNHFRRSLIGDARRLKRELEDKPFEATPQDLLYEILGLDPFLNQNLGLRVTAMSRAHIDAILSEQRLQTQQGVCDMEKLSNVSNESSE